MKSCYLADDLFSVSNITYDPIGNIQTLTRRGMTGCGPDLKKGEIDILTYDYSSDNDSQLRSIADAAPDEDLAAQGVNAKDGGEYGYDAAGRMTGDPYRGLTIRYNHLDLPREIDSPAGLIQITYDANGRKRLYHVENKYTRRYAGPLTFEKPADKDDYTLEAAATGDGRLVYDADHEEIYPEYHHRDHLGNTRLAFTDRNEDKLVEIIGNGNEVTQVLDFYPFGLQQAGEGVFGAVAESSNRYKYNGKELDDDIGLYDYGARWYDAATARWGQVDPLADIYTSISAYAYVANNPLIFIDPDGMSISSSNSGVRLTGADAQNYFKSLQNSVKLDQGMSGNSESTMTYSHQINYAGSVRGDQNDHTIHEIEKWTETTFSEEGNVKTEREVTRRGSTTIDKNGDIIKSWSSTTTTTSRRKRTATSRGYQWVASDPIESVTEFSLTQDASNRSERARKYVFSVQGHLRESGPNWSPFGSQWKLGAASAGSGFAISFLKLHPALKKAFSAGVILGNAYRGAGDHRERSGLLYYNSKTID